MVIAPVLGLGAKDGADEGEDVYVMESCKVILPPRN